MLCISNCGQTGGYFVRRMWRYRNSVNRNLAFTWRLLLSDHAPSEKLPFGTRRAEEVRFGSHGGLKAREGTGSEGDRRSQTTKQRLRNDLHPFGGASFNPGGGPFAGRGRAGRKAGDIPRRAARAERPGSGLRKGRLARGGRFGGKGSTVRSAAGTVPDESSQPVGRLRRRGAGRQRPEPTHRGRSGRAA